jgi:hypothetical protein
VSLNFSALLCCVVSETKAFCPAEMNSTYSKVQEESIATWKFQRLGLVLEFSQSSVWPGPLSVFEDVWLLLKSLCCAKERMRRSTASSHGALECSALEEATVASDWFEWLARAGLRNQLWTWKGQLGGYFYFPPGEEIKLSEQLFDNQCNGRYDDWKGQAKNMRKNADIVGNALHTWLRLREDGDQERKLTARAAQRMTDRVRLNHNCVPFCKPAHCCQIYSFLYFPQAHQSFWVTLDIPLHFQDDDEKARRELQAIKSAAKEARKVPYSLRCLLPSLFTLFRAPAFLLFHLLLTAWDDDGFKT